MDGLEKLKPLALLLLRLALGAIFIFHGYPKLFGQAHQAEQDFIRVGLPGYSAYIAGVIEFFGGCMLVAGLFTRVAGLLLTVEMAVGLWKFQRIFSDPLAIGGYQLPLALAAGAFALAALGPGIVSFDHAFFRSRRAPARKVKVKN
jgi:putative oxidoreductase